VLETLVAEEPKNVGLRLSLTSANVSLGQRLTLEDHPEQAIAAADPNDADIRIYLAEGYANLGKSLALAGWSKEGLADIEKAIGMCRGLLRSDPENNLVPEVLYIAYENLGDLHRDLALKSKGPATQGTWRLAREAYVKERDTLLALKAAGKLPELRYKVIDEAEGKIARCDQAMARSAGAR